jgi:hypothetical protein
LRKRRRVGARPILFEDVFCKIRDGEFARAAPVEAEVHIGDGGTRRGVKGDDPKIFVPAFAQVESAAQLRPDGARTGQVERANNAAHVVLNAKVSGESGDHGIYVYANAGAESIIAIRQSMYMHINVPHKAASQASQTLYGLP